MPLGRSRAVRAGLPCTRRAAGATTGGAVAAPQRTAEGGSPRGRPRPGLASPRAPPLRAEAAPPNTVQNSIYWPTLRPRPAPALRAAPSSPPTTQQPAAFSRPGLYILNSDGVRSPPPCEARLGEARGVRGGARRAQGGRAAEHGVRQQQGIPAGTSLPGALHRGLAARQDSGTARTTARCAAFRRLEESR